ncbi:MAG: hypothetical protein ACLP2P_11730 [Desulfobaccales bacterium]
MEQPMTAEKWANNKDYKQLMKFPDELLENIMAHYSSPAGTTGPFPEYKLCLDIIHMRENKRLVEGTERLAKATWFLAIGTLLASIFGQELLGILRWPF